MIFRFVHCDYTMTWPLFPLFHYLHCNFWGTGSILVSFLSPSLCCVVISFWSLLAHNKFIIFPQFLLNVCMTYEIKRELLLSLRIIRLYVYALQIYTWISPKSALYSIHTQTVYTRVLFCFVHSFVFSVLLWFFVRLNRCIDVSVETHETWQARGTHHQEYTNTFVLYAKLRQAK